MHSIAIKLKDRFLRVLSAGEPRNQFQHLHFLGYRRERGA